jgi:hypothetical protein
MTEMLIKNENPFTFVNGVSLLDYLWYLSLLILSIINGAFAISNIA